jgi:hypothetical protein
MHAVFFYARMWNLSLTLPLTELHRFRVFVERVLRNV